jgi:hypothetical protein
MTRILARIGAGLVIGGLTLTLGACPQPANARLQVAGDALSRSADECLYDMRDRHQTWEVSRNCAALSALASEYIAAGGFDKEPTEIWAIADRARLTAWIARATSLAGGKPLSIW